MKSILSIFDSQKKRRILIQVPLKEKTIEAFKTEAGFQDHYGDFIKETYEWILENF